MMARKVIFMKIKTVSEITGLTTRAIRVYIDEQLIAPRFTENYLGRRAFDFSEEDVSALQNIATLRKYGFSIDEIRNILLDAQNSIAIIENVKQRTKTQMEEYSERLSVLSRVEDNKAYSIAELSAVLSQVDTKLEIPIEHPNLNVIKIVKSIAVFVIVWLPFVLVFGGFVHDMTFYAYPKINTKNILLTLLTLVPSISILIVNQIKPNMKRVMRRIILCLCIAAMPFSFVMPYGIATYSETTDFRHYRDFDPGCLATRNVVFCDVFPAWPRYFDNVENENGEFEAVYLNSKYYYRFIQGFDYTYDIYAEWPLEEGDFCEEVQRVKEIYEKAVLEKTYGYKFVEMEKGAFSCLILYDGHEPFQNEPNSYQYLIFAYDEDTNRVRYIYCDSLENGVDQPYYLELDW
jgi:DNA-binding transcriptional MerR regulator